MASQSQITCVEQRNLVRSSSNCRCGSQRLRKERSCKVCAYSPARVRKASDRGLSVAEDTFSGGRIQPKGSRRQHHCDLLGGRFQAVQGGVASSTESGMRGLATECLDLLNATICAISKEARGCQRL